MVAFDKKSWKDMNYGERLNDLARMYKQADEKISREVLEAQEKRAKLLQLKPGERTVVKTYEFTFPRGIILKDEDEEKVKFVLEQIGKQRYEKYKPDFKYVIFDTDREIRRFEGAWSWLELRFPNHYAGYIESMNVSRDSATNWHLERGQTPQYPTSLRVLIVKGEDFFRDSRANALLYREAKSAFRQIKQGLLGLVR